MNPLTQILIAVAAIALGYWLGRKYPTRRAKQGGEQREKKEFTGVVGKQSAQKEEGLAKLSEHIAEQGRVTNSDVEELLGVSDATATRYLQELAPKHFSKFHVLSLYFEKQRI